MLKGRFDVRTGSPVPIPVLKMMTSYVSSGAVYFRILMRRIETPTGVPSLRFHQKVRFHSVIIKGVHISLKLDPDTKNFILHNNSKIFDKPFLLPDHHYVFMILRNQW